VQLFEDLTGVRFLSHSIVDSCVTRCLATWVAATIINQKRSRLSRKIHGHEDKMKMLLNEINYLLFLLLLQFGSMGSQCPAQKIVSFDNVIPPTLTQALCAEIHDNVSQANNKKLTDCSMQYPVLSMLNGTEEIGY